MTATAGATSLPKILRQRAFEARKTMEHLRDSTHLGGSCVAASFLLQRLALADGVKISVVSGVAVRRVGRRYLETGHAWCEHGRVIIDITATQFWSVPGVYVVASDATPRYGSALWRDEFVWAVTVGAASVRADLAAAEELARRLFPREVRATAVEQRSQEG